MEGLRKPRQLSVVKETTTILASGYYRKERICDMIKKRQVNDTQVLALLENWCYSFTKILLNLIC